MPGCQTAFQHLLALKSKSGLEDAGLSMWAACVPQGGLGRHPFLMSLFGQSHSEKVGGQKEQDWGDR